MAPLLEVVDVLDSDAAVKEPTPAKNRILEFDAVFKKTRVVLNGDTVSQQETIQRHLHDRQKMLCALKNTKSRAEMKLLFDYEDMFRAHMLELLSQRGCDEMFNKEREILATKVAVVSGTRPQEELTSTSSSRTFLEKLRYQLEFEMKYSLPGVLGLLLYCCTHVACFELCTLAIIEPTKNIDRDEAVHFVVLISSLFLSRLSGGVFQWISEEKEEEVERIEREGRNCQEFIEMEVFRKRKGLKQVVTIACFYLCYVSVGFFYQGKFMKPLDNRNAVLKGLPSLNQGLTTHISDLLATKQPGFLLAAHQRELLLNESGLTEALPGVINSTFGFCEENARLAVPPNLQTTGEAALTVQDEDYLFDKVTVSSYTLMLGDPDAPMLSPRVSCVYYLVGAIVGLALLKKFDISMD